MTSLFVSTGVGLLIIALLLYVAIPSRRQKRIDEAKSVDYTIPEPQVQKFDEEEERLIQAGERLANLPLDQVLARHKLFRESEGPFSSFQLEFFALIESELRYRYLLVEDRTDSALDAQRKYIEEALDY